MVDFETCVKCRLRNISSGVKDLDRISDMGITIALFVPISRIPLVWLWGSCSGIMFRKLKSRMLRRHQACGRVSLYKVSAQRWRCRENCKKGYIISTCLVQVSSCQFPHGNIARACGALESHDSGCFGPTVAHPLSSIESSSFVLQMSPRLGASPITNK